MAINILKKAANGSVVVHVTGTGTINCTGNDTISDLASTGEIVTRAKIKQIWTGSSSGNGANFVVSRGNSTVNTVVAVYDSTAWIDYAGNGMALNLAEDGAAIYFTLNNATEGQGYLMLELKKEIG
jgi:hypothetical protein